MHPILASFGQFHIYSYGVMVAIGAAVATYLMCRDSRTAGIDCDTVIDLVVWALIGGIIGGRLLYVALNFPYYRAQPSEIIDLTRGGLVWYGGFFGGLAAVWGFARLRGVAFLVLTDFFVPFLALAQAFGRIGCFMNGCCYGVPVSSTAFGIVFPDSDTALCPAQLYSSAALVVIYVILRFVQQGPHRRGMVTVVYVLLYGIKRFGVEFMRGDNPKIFMGLTMSQVTSVIAVCVACAAAHYLNRRHHGERV